MAILAFVAGMAVLQPRALTQADGDWLIDDLILTAVATPERPAGTLPKLPEAEGSHPPRSDLCLTPVTLQAGPVTRRPGPLRCAVMIAHPRAPPLLLT